MATVALATAGSWLAKTVLGESFKFLGVSAAGWGWLAGSLLGSALFGPKIPTQYGPRISDLKTPSGAYGVAIPKVFGTIKVAGRIIWASDIREVKIVKVYKKKFFFGLIKKKYTVVTYEYYADFAVAFCEGEASITKVWFDQKVVFDESTSTTPDAVLGKNINMTSYEGTETQSPNPDLESAKGVGNVSAYRGLCYAVFTNVFLNKFGGRIPAVSAEVVRSAPKQFPVILKSFPSGTFDTQCDSEVFPAELDGGLIKSAAQGYISWYDLNGNKAKEVPYSSTTLDILCASSFNNKPNYMIFVLTSWSNRKLGIIIRDTGEYGYLRSPDGSLQENQATCVRCNSVALWPDGESFAYPYYVDPSNYGLGVWTVKDVIYGTGIPYKYYPSFPNMDFSGIRNFFTCVDEEGYIWIAYGRSDSISYYKLVKLDENLNILLEKTMPVEIPQWSTGGDGFVVAHNRLWVEGKVYDIDTMNIVGYYNGGAPLYLRDKNFIISSTTLGAAHFYYADYLPQKSSWPVDQILSDISTEVGLKTTDFDYSQLSSIFVDGYALSRPMTARAAIETLAQAFFFDMTESDGKLKAVLRGSSPSISVPDNDMVPQGDDKTTIETTVVQELELPYRVEVGYIQKDKYKTGLQHASRPDKANDITNKYQVELAIVMDDNKAVQVAEVLLYDLWTAKNRVTFSLPYKYVELDPGDVINLSVNGITRTIRITRIGYQASSIMVEGVYDNPSIYSPVKQGGNSIGQIIESISSEVNTEAQLLDIPILQDTDDDAGFYFAGTPLGDTSLWSGSELYASDDGAAWNGVGFVDNAVPIGYAETILGDGPTTIWDDGNTLTVRIYSGTLNSATDIDVLNGQNYLLVGNEIIQFGDAVQNADGTYTLSRLLRGRKGTEWSTSSHVQYERVVLLDRTSLDRVVYSSTYLNVKRLYRAPSVGQAVLDAPQFEFTNTGIGLKPYSPVHIKAVDAGAGNYDVTWVRRTRVGGEWNDFIDVPLGEESEQYVVEVWRSGSMISSTTTTTTSATVAAQSGDTIRVAQVSTIVGNGFYAAVTV